MNITDNGKSDGERSRDEMAWKIAKKWVGQLPVLEQIVHDLRLHALESSAEAYAYHLRGDGGQSRRCQHQADVFRGRWEVFAAAVAILRASEWDMGLDVNRFMLVRPPPFFNVDPLENAAKNIAGRVQQAQIDKAIAENAHARLREIQEGFQKLGGFPSARELVAWLSIPEFRDALINQLFNVENFIQKLNTPQGNVAGIFREIKQRLAKAVKESAKQLGRSHHVRTFLGNQLREQVSMGVGQGGRKHIIDAQRCNVPSEREYNKDRSNKGE